MDIKALKQYVEKELQAKRFLGETLEFLEVIDGLKETHAQLVKQTERLNAGKFSAEKSFEAAHEKLNEASAKLNDAEAMAGTIVERATVKASEIIAEANDAASEIKNKGATALKKLAASIEAGEMELMDVNKKLEAANLDLVKIEKLKQSLQAALK